MCRRQMERGMPAVVLPLAPTDGTGSLPLQASSQWASPSNALVLDGSELVLGCSWLTDDLKEG